MRNARPSPTIGDFAASADRDASDVVSNVHHWPAMAELSTPAPTSGRSPRRILRWMAGAVGVIVALVLVAAVALQTSTARRMILERVTSLLASLNISLEAE